MRKLLLTLNIIFIVTILLISGFRALIDNIPYFISFDKVAKVTISEGWNFISNPTIFITLCIFILLIIFRQHLPMVLSSITELKAWNLEAKLDSSKLSSSILLNNAEKPQTNTEKGSEDFLDITINNLDDSLCWFFLKYDSKIINIKDLLNNLFSDTELNSLFTNDLKVELNPREKFYVSYGYFVGILFLKGIIFSLSKAEGKNNFLIRLLPNVSEKINTKLKISKKLS